ncbi:hypothetical protein P885DRAFT_60670 [Corynascus similis CBS 632.67]
MNLPIYPTSTLTKTAKKPTPTIANTTNTATLLLSNSSYHDGTLKQGLPDPTGCHIEQERNGDWKLKEGADEPYKPSIAFLQQKISTTATSPSDSRKPRHTYKNYRKKRTESTELSKDTTKHGTALYEKPTKSRDLVKYGTLSGNTSGTGKNGYRRKNGSTGNSTRKATNTPALVDQPAISKSTGMARGTRHTKGTPPDSTYGEKTMSRSHGSSALRTPASITSKRSSTTTTGL